MKLFYKFSDDYNSNCVVKHSDNSFGSKNVYFDFQVSLSAKHLFFLNFDIYTKKCVSCEGYLLIDKKTASENISIEKFANGELLIDLEDFEKETSISHCLLGDKIKYDVNKSRICIGDINDDLIIMFGKGQYASFQDDKLIGIIVDLT